MTREHPNAIPITDECGLSEDSYEVARIWITNQGGSTVRIAAYILDDPRVFGYLMADAVRHAARAYAGTYDMDEGEALQAIADGLGEELREQFGTLTTVQKGSLDS